MPPTKGKVGSDVTAEGTHVDTETPDITPVVSGWVDTVVIVGTVLGMVLWAGTPVALGVTTPSTSSWATPDCRLLGAAVDDGGRPDNPPEKDPTIFVRDVGNGGPV